MTKKRVYFIIFFYSIFVDAKFDSTKEMINFAGKLSSLSGEEYIFKVEEIRDQLEKYIENKKRVCNGEFSSEILSKTESDTHSKKSVKLTKEERKVCFRELKQVQQKYIESLFDAKKNYMLYLHTLRLKQLENSKDLALKSLMNSFNKKGRR